MPLLPSPNTTLRWLSALVCIAALAGCPKADDNQEGFTASDTGATNDDGDHDGVDHDDHMSDHADDSNSAAAGTNAHDHDGNQSPGLNEASSDDDDDDDGTVAGMDSDAGTDEGEGQLCGTRGAGPCAEGEFCNFEPDVDCGGTDKGGTCEVMPEACIEIYEPVCGCDTKSYGNACAAHMAGVSVMHTGACTASDCEKIAGRVAVGIGPAPMCEADEVEHTYVNPDNGSIAIEGMLCCLKK